MRRGLPLQVPGAYAAHFPPFLLLTRNTAYTSLVRNPWLETLLLAHLALRPSRLAKPTLFGWSQRTLCLHICLEQYAVSLGRTSFEVMLARPGDAASSSDTGRRAPLYTLAAGPEDVDLEQARALKRPRLVWTAKLHKRFVEAVEQLGLKNAVPKTIMQVLKPIKSG